MVQDASQTATGEVPTPPDGVTASQTVTDAESKSAPPPVTQDDINNLKASMDKKLAAAQRAALESMAREQQLANELKAMQTKQKEADVSLMTADELAEHKMKELEDQNRRLSAAYAQMQEQVTYGPMYARIAADYQIDWDNPPEGLDLAPDAPNHGARLARIALSAAKLREKELQAKLAGVKDEVKKQEKQADSAKPATPSIERGGPSANPDVLNRIRNATPAELRELVKRSKTEKILPSQVLR